MDYLIMAPPRGKTGPLEKIDTIHCNDYDSSLREVVRRVACGDYPQGSFSVMAKIAKTENKFHQYTLSK
jgi:hypothetical protein